MSLDDLTEYKRMITSQPYSAADPYIRKIASQRRKKLKELNAEDDDDKKLTLIRDFFTCAPDAEIYIMGSNFFCEYGSHIRVGTQVVFNANCVILDVCPVTIGSRTMFGPNVQIYTATHPLSPEERNGLKGRESALPIKIGDDCWIGGSAVILPGITIGNGVTVGAGSVVTKDIPDRAVVVGNPAKVVKTV